MDHAINQLRGYMLATVDMWKDNASKEEMRSEMKAYVDALNSMEKYYYGKPKTSLETVLSNFRE